MNPRLPSEASDLTRREALQAGGASAAAAFLLLNLPEAAWGAAGADPSHLLRSTWRDAGARHLRSGTSVLRLESVRDVSAAHKVPALQGSEDAFSLIFSGPAGLEVSDRPLRMTNRALGTFDLSVVEVSEGRYEAVVNRVLSKRARRRTPPRRKARTATSGPAEPPAERQAIGKVRAVRKRGGARVLVQLDAGVDSVTIWLRRGDKVVAAASKRVRGKKRAAIMLKRKRRLRKGEYEIYVMATERDGEQSYRRVRTRLR